MGRELRRAIAYIRRRFIQNRDSRLDLGRIIIPLRRVIVRDCQWNAFLALASAKGTINVMVIRGVIFHRARSKGDDLIDIAKERSSGRKY